MHWVYFVITYTYIYLYIPPAHLNFTDEGTGAQRGKIQGHMTGMWQKLNSNPGDSTELLITASLHE